MPERAYTVAEIDRMRRALESILIQPLQPYDPREMDARIEGRLRSYMSNGTTVGDLEREAAETFRRRNPPWPEKPALPAAYSYGESWEVGSWWASGRAQGHDIPIMRRGEPTEIMLRWWREHPHAPAKAEWLRGRRRYGSLEDAITRTDPLEPC